MAERCECVTCCDGEHAGRCKECAGWGDRLTETGVEACAHCGGTGTCPRCGGEEEQKEADRG